MTEQALTQAGTADQETPPLGAPDQGMPRQRALQQATPAGPDPATSSPGDAANLRVAHLLLRSGNVLAARAQLETLAGRRKLDVRGLLDLAESRWRTGDLAGAGDASAAYLELAGQDPLAIVIAAEAAAAQGRPGEARGLAKRALDGLTLPLEAVFAGQPRSSIWPHDPAAAAHQAGTLYTGAPAESRHPGGSSRPSAAATVARPGRMRDSDGGSVSNAAIELEAARSELTAGDERSAVIRLALVLRFSPALAPAVLDLVGQLPGPEFDVLRGDALRLVGHESAAERAFASAAESLRESTPTRSSP